MFARSQTAELFAGTWKNIFARKIEGKAAK
jgi:hypothetical protein